MIIIVHPPGSVLVISRKRRRFTKRHTAENARTKKNLQISNFLWNSLVID